MPEYKYDFSNIPFGVPDEEETVAPALSTPSVEASSMPEATKVEDERSNPTLMTAIKRYARNNENKIFKDDDEAYDWYVNDRRWKDANTVSITKELNFVKGLYGTKKASDQDLQDLQVIKQAWDARPTMFGRLAEGEFAEAGEAFVSNVAKGLVDPTVLLGGPIGRGVSFLTGKVAGKVVSKGMDIGIRTGSGVAVDAGVSAGANVATQEINVEAGLQKDVNPWEAVTAGALGGVISAPGHYFASRPKAERGLADPEWAARAAKKAAPALEKQGFSRDKGLLSDKKTFELPGDAGTVDRTVIGKVGEEPAPMVSEPTAPKTAYDEAFEIAESWMDPASKADARSLLNTFKSANGVLGKEFFDRFYDPKVEIPKAMAKGASPEAVRYYKTFEGLKKQLASLSSEYYFTNDEIKGDVFDNIMKAFEITHGNERRLASRGVVTDKTALEEAKKSVRKGDIYTQAEDVVNAPTGQVPNKEASVKLDLIGAGLHQEWIKYTKMGSDAVAKGETLSTEDAKRLARIVELYPMYISKRSGISSEQGRSLQALKVVKPNSVVGLFKKSENIVRGFGGKDMSEDAFRNTMTEISMAASKLDMSNALEVDVFLQNLNKASGSDMIKELWYNSLLSAPSTFMINTIGNLSVQIVDSVERNTAGALTDVNRGGMGWRAAGYARSWMEAARVGFRAFRTEIPSDPNTRQELAHGQSVPTYVWDDDLAGINRFRKAGVGEKGIGGRQTRIPGRLLMATDEFFKTIHFNAYLTERGAERAKAAGLTNTLEVQRYIDNYRTVASKEDLEYASEMARKLTFTNDPGTLTRSIQTFVDNVPGGRLVMPFVRTPSNILQYAGDMVLFNRTKRNKVDWEAGGIQRNQMLARNAMGYSIMGSAIVMASAGLITGPAPTDPAERVTWEANEMRPWSIRIGNQWVQWNRLDPVAIPFALGAGIPGIITAMNDPVRETAFMNTTMGLLSDAILDKSWFQGVQNVVEAINAPERNAETLGKSIVRTFVPSIVAASARAYDPRTTAPRTFMEVIQDRIGFEAREKVPTAVDVLGFEKKIEVVGTGKDEQGVLSFVNRMANPFAATTITNDPVKKELDNLRIAISKPSNKWKGVELTSEQLYIYSKARGQQIYDGMKWFMQSPEWAKASVPEKRLMIDELKSAAGEIADIALIGVYPEILELQQEKDPKMKKLLGPTREELQDKGLKPNPDARGNKTPLTTPPKKDIIGSLGVDVIDSQNPGVTYDPITQQLTRGPGVSDEDVASLVKGKDSKWKEQTIKVKLEDGRTVDVSADKASKIMKSKLTKARKMMEELDAT